MDGQNRSRILAQQSLATLLELASCLRISVSATSASQAWPRLGHGDRHWRRTAAFECAGVGNFDVH
jgi:hypothetical protein